MADSTEVLWVAAPRQVVDEVLVNLFRNALQASQGQLPIRIGVQIGVDISPVTALETVCVAVRDQALGNLSDDDIARRPVDRGLGLVRARLALYEGGLLVRPEALPWHKAVVARLPRAQAGDA